MLGDRDFLESEMEQLQVNLTETQDLKSKLELQVSRKKQEIEDLNSTASDLKERVC